MKISENYDVRELVPPEMWDKYGEKSIWFVNKHCVDFLEWLSSYLAVHVIVNNWHFFLENPHPTGMEDWYLGGHIYHDSGFRPRSCDVGADNGQHRFKDGVDCKARGYVPETLRKIVRDNFKVLNQRFGLTTIEKDTPTWAHADFRWTGLDHLFEVSFK